MKSNPVKVNSSETELWNCENAFDFVCPRKWDALGHTESPEIRYCEVCSKNVYLCESPAEFARQGNLGRCVAVPTEMTPRQAFREYRMGRYSADGVKRMRENYEREKEWWEGVLAVNPTFNTEEIDEIRRKFKPLK